VPSLRGVQPRNEPQPFPLKDIQVGKEDGRGIPITHVYAAQAGDYAIYQAGDVMIHLADQPEKAQAQRRSILPLSSARADLVGAAFSIALAIRGRTVALDTDLLDNVTDGTLRLLIGVISAGVLLLLLACGILPSLKIGDANFSGAGLTWQMVLIVGFVGGFLERLVPDLLEKKNPQSNGGTNTAVAGAHS
jgi:hypothetical protein